MMRLTLFLLSFCLPFLLKSQDTTIFAPRGSIFYYSTWVQVPYPELLTFVSEGDTLLNGIYARVLNFYQTEGDVLVAVPELNKFVYTSGNKVYYWVQDDFYLLYDFGADVGDTIHSRVESFPHSLSCFSDLEEPFNFSYIIDSTGITNIDGTDLRYQYVSPVYGGVDHLWIIDSPIVERFGPYTGPDFWWGRGEGCALGGFPGGLRCYTDHDIHFKNEFTHFDLPCDYISKTENISDDLKKIYPNPSTALIRLSDEAEEYFIYDLFGRTMAEGKNESVINIQDIPSNIYIINYKIENTWTSEIIIKN